MGPDAVPELGSDDSEVEMRDPTEWELAFSPFDVPPSKDRLHAYKWQLATDKQAKKLDLLWRRAVEAASGSADPSGSGCDLNFFLAVGQGRYSTVSYKIYNAQSLDSISVLKFHVLEVEDSFRLTSQDC